MKRILIISPCPGEGAGAEIVLEELLRAWTDDELKLILMTPVGSRIHRVALEKGFEWNDLQVKKNGLYLRDNLRAVKAAHKAASKCDRVHAWSIRVFPAAEWLGRQWNVPISGTLHDNPFPRKIHGLVLWDLRGMDFRRADAWKEMLWNSQEYSLRTWWRWQWAHRTANRFAQLICVSEAVRQECERKGYQCKLSIIRNGIADQSTPGKVLSDKVRIGFLGMEYPQRKGFSVIEQWIPRLGNQVAWQLYGNASENTLKRLEAGNQRSEVRGQASDSHTAEGRGWCYCASNEATRGGKKHEGAQKNQESYPRTPILPHSLTLPSVDYRGFQNRETIFSEIDILVHTSTLFDPLPTVLIEAARAGIPCVASSNGGAGEIVEDGVSGFIFDPANPDEGLKMLGKQLNPDLRKEMGTNARRIFEERFRVERMATEYRLVFAGLFGGGTCENSI